MTITNRPLDVLVLEPWPRWGADAVAALEAAGHRVHRCHEEDAPTFPCRGVLNRADCPLLNPVDVAVVTRPDPDRPSDVVDGASCAIRAGVPIVELGPPVEHALKPWLVARTENAAAVPGLCAQATAHRYDAVGPDLHRLIERRLIKAGLDPVDVECRVVRDGQRLRVDIRGKGLDQHRQSIAVRAYEALRALGTEFGTIDIAVAG